jgi:hypothetical protein
MPSNELEAISVLLNVMFIMQQYMNLLADEENVEAEYQLAQADLTFASDLSHVYAHQTMPTDLLMRQSCLLPLV